MANNKNRLPNRTMLHYLSGVVLSDPEFAESWRKGKEFIRFGRKFAEQILPASLKAVIKKRLIACHDSV